MRKAILSAALLAPLLTGAPALAAGPYINFVELVVIPADLPKFLAAATENAAASVHEPGVREYNITQLAGNPNHVFFYEVYDDEAAHNAHRAGDNFKKFQAATTGMVADRNIREMAVVQLRAKDR